LSFFVFPCFVVDEYILAFSSLNDNKKELFVFNGLEFLLKIIDKKRKKSVGFVGVIRRGDSG
jgi:hypothetical protein